MGNIENQVTHIIEHVARDGDKALRYYLKKFDRVNLKPAHFKIAGSALKEAFSTLPLHLKKALIAAKNNIAYFYRTEKKQVVKNWFINRGTCCIGQKWIPLDAVGIYVPGGLFAYPSTLLMTAVPARLAGVKRIVAVSPPGKITREVLAAAWISGVDEFFRVGGPAAIAALAYGTRTIRKVDKICGPGNKYVTTAKKLLFGTVGIDMLAGPSEIAIVADSVQDIDAIIQDIKAQKEHDVHAQAFLISLDKDLSREVKKRFPAVTVLSVQTIREAATAVNDIAPEHTELITRNDRKLLSLITASGTICIGKLTPVALSDYVAGPSHVLPTGGTARFSSGLSIIDFYRRINTVRNAGITSDFKHSVLLADAEGMIEHTASLQRRIKQ